MFETAAREQRSQRDGGRRLYFINKIIIYRSLTPPRGCRGRSPGGTVGHLGGEGELRGGQADDPGGGRRSGRLPGGDARPARPLRPRLPRAQRDVRRRGAPAPRRARPARSPDRPGGLRPADAEDDRHRGARRGTPPVAGHQAAAAHGVRRHRRGDRGDQRDRSRLLPAQAVGPTRGAALPRHRRPARRLERRSPRPGLDGPRGRPPVVGPDRRHQDVPGAQPRAVPLARHRARRRGSPARRARGRGAGRAAARAGPRRRDAAGTLRDAAGRGARAAHQAGAAALRPGHRRRRPGRTRRRGVRRVGGAADRGGRARRTRRPGRDRARRSRTTSASPRGCPEPT